MSKELREYLATYLAWVESGAPDGSPFMRAWGLCSNVDLHRWSAADRDLYDRVAVELAEAFVSSLLDPDYPFGGYIVYWEANKKSRQHENARRLAWIREQLSRQE